LTANTSGINNIAIGAPASVSLTSGSQNIAIGDLALNANTTGNFNVALGFESLLSATALEFNVAVGAQALRAYNNTAANTGRNTAVGYQSMFRATTGSYNTAMGYQTLDANTTGQLNTAIGYAAMPNSTTASNNTAAGYDALDQLSTANNNTAYGYQALATVNTGGNNTAIGFQAGPNFFGGANTNATAVGYQAVTTASNQVRIGNNFVTSIGGFAAWTNLSDGRYKTNIQQNVPGLDFILKLQPVTYNFDFDKLNKTLKPGGADAPATNENNPNVGVRYSGFVAQDVEKAAKEIGYDFSGVDKAKSETDLYGLRYSEFVVPMVKAIQEQQAQIELLKKQNETLLKAITELQNKK
jgi:hypothetical protein